MTGGRAVALDVFECLRGLLSVTERANLQAGRKGVEKPFFEGDYLVFPEVSRRRLAGFYVYKDKKAWHYDAIERLKQVNGSSLFPLVSAPFTQNHLYQMVSQPDGLRTLTLFYKPGPLSDSSTAEAPVALGSTVLPVVGAWIGRARPATQEVYRKPASTPNLPKPASMVRLTSKNTKDNDALWYPLLTELRLRKHWIQSHNLDLRSFKDLSRLLEGVCKE